MIGALADAHALGYKVKGAHRPGLTAGSRSYMTSSDVDVLRERIDDPQERRRLLEAVPPLRLGVRFWDARGPDGAPGGLLLEYDNEGRLIGASFGWDGIVQAGLQPYAGPDFADRIATRLLGRVAENPEIVRMVHRGRRSPRERGAKPSGRDARRARQLTNSLGPASGGTPRCALRRAAGP